MTENGTPEKLPAMVRFMCRLGWALLAQAFGQTLFWMYL